MKPAQKNLIPVIGLFLILTSCGSSPQKSEAVSKSPPHSTPYSWDQQVIKVTPPREYQFPIPPWFSGITLLDAVQMGDLAAVKYRVSVAGDNPTAWTGSLIPDGGGPIHAAARNGELPILKYFVEELGIPIDSPDEFRMSPLHYATQKCELETIKYLVEKGAEPSLACTCGITPLTFAVGAGNSNGCPRAVSYLLGKGAEVSELERGGGDTLLHVAAVRSHNNVQILSAILEGGGAIHLEAKNLEGLTPLQYALSRNVRPSVVKYLIARGADVRTRDGNGDTLLHSAVLRGMELSLVEYLVESGVDTNARNKGGLTALELSKAGSPVHEYLLKVEKNPSEFTTTTQAPPPDSPPPPTPPPVPLEYKFMSLAEAVQNGDLEAVRFRISTGDSISSSQDEDGLAPVHIAVKSGNLPILKYLVEEAEAGVADIINSPDNHQFTPLHHSVGSRKSATLLRYLVARGANLTAANSGGLTPLHEAAKGVLLEPVQVLVEAGAAANSRDELGGTTPLHWASFRCVLHIARFLVEEHGADVNARDNVGGSTPLGNAVHPSSGGGGACKNPLPLVKYLVRRGADVNTRNDAGQNLLHLAAARNPPLLPLFQFLVQSGVEVSAKDEAGNTPLHEIAGGWFVVLGRYGAKEEQRDVIKYLVESGGADVNAENGDGVKPIDKYGGGDEQIKRLLTPKKNMTKN